MFGWIKRAIGLEDTPVSRHAEVRDREDCGCNTVRSATNFEDWVSYGPDTHTTCDACLAQGLRFKGYGVWEPELSVHSMTPEAIARWAVFVDGVRLDVSTVQYASRAGVTIKIDGKQVVLSQYAVILPVEALA